MEKATVEKKIRLPYLMAKEIDSLIAGGEYKYLSDFVRVAINDKLKTRKARAKLVNGK